MDVRRVAKSVPGLRRTVRLAKRKFGDIFQPLGGFYTLSPDVLVALVKVFRQIDQERRDGRDLIAGHAYYEFGLYRGFSIWYAEQLTRELDMSDLRLYGFDSFEGLPDPQLDVEAAIFSRGDFRGSYDAVTKHLVDWKADLSRIALFKGFYSQSAFASFSATEKFLPAAVCLIDVDLYESCVPVLEFMSNYLVPGSFVLFDDFNQIGDNNAAGERRALAEFQSAQPGIRLDHVFDYGWEGAVYRVSSIEERTSLHNRG